MKRGLKYLSLFLSLCLMLTLFSGFTNADIIADVQDIQENIISEEPVLSEFVEDTPIEYLEETEFPEIISKEEIAENQYVGRLKGEEQNEYTLVLRNADGSNTLRLFDYPVKYTDATGKQNDISLDLEKRTDGGYQTAANSIMTTFPQKLSDGISLEYEDVAVKMVPVEHGNVAATLQTASLVADRPSVVTATANLSADKKVVSYPYDNQTTIEYSLTYTGFKEDIVVEEYTGQTEYTFRLYTNGLTLVEEDGSYYLADETGVMKATIGDIIIFTADERNNTFGNMTYETITANEEYVLTIHVDAEYLRDEKTAYPIRIDPTLEISYDNNGSGAIQDVTINSAAGSSGSSGSLMIGKRETYGMSRVLMKFPGLNLSSFLSVDQIKSAAVEIRDLMCESEMMEVYCYPFTGNTWTESTANWSNVSPNSYSTSTYFARAVSYAHGNNMSNKHRYRFNVTTVVKGWKSGSYSQSKGIIFKATSAVENGSTYIYKTFASYNRSTNKPSLIVTYNPTITLSTASTSLYVGKTVTLKASTYPAMTVSWSSSNSSVATVSSAGVVTAKKIGNTTITAQCTDSSGDTYSATCRVYVKIENGVYYIKNKYSNLYLHVQNGKIANNTNVYQNSKLNSEPSNLRQMWKVYYLGSGYYSIRPMHKLNMGLSTSGTNVCIYNINTVDTSSAINTYAKWTIEGTTDGCYVFKRSGSDSTVLSLTTESTASGTNIEVQTNGNYQRQKWVLEKILDPPEGVLLYNTASGARVASSTEYVAPGESLGLSELKLVAAVYSGNSINQSVSWRSSNPDVATVDISTGKVTGISPGTVTITGSKASSNVVYSVSFSLIVTPITNGTYFIENKRFKTYVDIENQTMSSGTIIHQWEFHGGSSQKWIFTHEGDGYYSIKSANASGSYYLGVKDDSTENDVTVVLRTGTLTNGMKWKIETTTSGAYKITPKTGVTNKRVLAVGGAALGFEDDNGIDIEQRDYVEDTNYKDEWFVHPYGVYPYKLLAYNENSVARNEYFTEVSSSINLRLTGDVYTDFYSNYLKSDMKRLLCDSDIFIVHTHGTQSGFMVSPNTFLSMSDMEEVVLDDLSFALLLTCKTGRDFSQNHITNNNPVNIVEQMVCSGAETVIGFTENTYVSDCNLFADDFMERTMGLGETVTQARDNIDYGDEYVQDMREICVIGGNTNLRLYN